MSTTNEVVTPATEALGQALESQGAGTAAPAQGGGSEAKLDGSPARETETPAKTESASSAFSAIAKERKKFLAAQKQLKEREQQIADREKRIQEMEGKPKTEKPRDPIAALQAAGFSYQDAVNYMLNNNEPTSDMQVKELKEELSSYKREQEEERKREAEERKKQAESAHEEQVTAFKDQIAEFVSGNAETFELISQEDPGEVQNLIYNLIAQHYQGMVESFKEAEESGERAEKPRILSVKEGAELAEQWYEERIEKFMKTKKIQSRFAPKPTENEPKAKETGSKTLANGMTSSSASPNRAPSSEEERRERALRRLESLGT